jgi:hypothetical protein
MHHIYPGVLFKEDCASPAAAAAAARVHNFLKLSSWHALRYLNLLPISWVKKKCNSLPAMHVGCTILHDLLWSFWENATLVKKLWKCVLAS